MLFFDALVSMVCSLSVRLGHTRLLSADAGQTQLSDQLLLAETINHSDR